MKMNKISRKWLWLLPTLVISFSCSESDPEEPLGPEVEIQGGTVSNYSENYQVLGRDTILADSYKIAVNLKSDNPYASRYGINPIQKNRVTGINITTLKDFKSFANAGDNINSVFVVQKDDSNYYLYQTIESFIEKYEGKFDGISGGKLVFTNQDKIAVSSTPIILKGDTVDCEFRLDFKLDNSVSIIDTVKVTLVAN